MSAGKLTELINVTREVRVSDGAGGDSISLSYVARDVWAFVKPVKGVESGANNGVVATANYRFKIRNRADLKETDIIVWSSQRYNIRAILYTGNRSQYLEIDAERGVSQ